MYSGPAYAVPAAVGPPRYCPAARLSKSAIPALGYVAAISVGVTVVPAVARGFARFAPAGRIGLTNYLLQSTTMTLLFSHYGASLKQPSAAVRLGINLVFFFGLQLPFSRWWIRRFRFGPAEWVWRSLTLWIATTRASGNGICGRAPRAVAGDPRDRSEYVTRRPSGISPLC